MRNETVSDIRTITSAFTSDPITTRWGKGLAASVSATVAASTAKTFVDGDVDVTGNTITKTGIGTALATGRKVAATSGGTLPGGLSTTNYYVISVSADVIKLAASLSDALANIAVDITSAAGGGTHTLTPAALSGASLKFQWSPDGTNWFDISGQSQNITTTGVIAYSFEIPNYAYVQYVAACAAGQLDLDIEISTERYRIN